MSLIELIKINTALEIARLQIEHCNHMRIPYGPKPLTDSAKGAMLHIEEAQLILQQAAEAH